MKKLKILLVLMLCCFAVTVLLGCGSDFEVVVNDGEATIIGLKTEGLEEIIIPETYNGVPVTKIGDSAFEKNNDIKSISLPHTLTEIGDQAFRNCNSLTSIDLSFVKSIGKQAFYMCGNLQTVILNEELESVGEKAFYNSNKITDINIPQNLLSVGAEAFAFSAPSKTNIDPKGENLIVELLPGEKKLFSIVPDYVGRYSFDFTQAPYEVELYAKYEQQELSVVEKENGKYVLEIFRTGLYDLEVSFTDQTKTASFDAVVRCEYLMCGDRYDFELKYENEFDILFRPSRSDESSIYQISTNIESSCIVLDGFDNVLYSNELNHYLSFDDEQLDEVYVLRFNVSVTEITDVSVQISTVKSIDEGDRRIEENNDLVLFRFVPDKTGIYMISSVGDLRCFDSNMQILSGWYESGEDGYGLEKDKVYYLQFGQNNADVSIKYDDKHVAWYIDGKINSGSQYNLTRGTSVSISKWVNGVFVNEFKVKPHEHERLDLNILSGNTLVSPSDSYVGAEYEVSEIDSEKDCLVVKIYPDLSKVVENISAWQEGDEVLVELEVLDPNLTGIVIKCVTADGNMMNYYATGVGNYFGEKLNLNIRFDEPITSIHHIRHDGKSNIKIYLDVLEYEKNEMRIGVKEGLCVYDPI